jgi:plasmid stabilization system protein ParE
MATVIVAPAANADLDSLIATHSLPGTTRDRMKQSLRALADFPYLGPKLTGAWAGFRFLLGPWPWMLLVYVYDEATDEVYVVTIQDARSGLSATSET